MLFLREGSRSRVIGCGFLSERNSRLCGHWLRCRMGMRGHLDPIDSHDNRPPTQNQAAALYALGELTRDNEAFARVLTLHIPSSALRSSSSHVGPIDSPPLPAWNTTPAPSSSSVGYHREGSCLPSSRAPGVSIGRWGGSMEWVYCET